MSDVNFPRATASRRGPGRPRREDVRDGDIREETINGEPRLTRNRTRHTDGLYVDPKYFRRGETMQWVRMQCYGKPDPSNFNRMAENHWKPIQLADRPQLAHLAAQKNDDGAIMNDGLVLCSRPSYLSEEAAEEDYNFAMEQVRTNVSQSIRQAPDGTFPRVGAKVGRDYAPLEPLAGMDLEA